MSLTVTGVIDAGAENVLTTITSGETAPTQGTFTDFGPTAASVAVTRQYQITNTGGTTVNLNGTPLVSISGDTADFTVTTQPGLTSLAPNATANFTVQFDPTAAGNDVADVSIASDDPSSPFTFQIQGESLTTTALAGGLQVATTANGASAISAANGDLLMMNYTGYLTDGSIFDTNTNPATPFQFTLGAGQVIAGWDQGLVGAKAGEQRTLIIPGALAYGTSPPPGSIIPANAELIFTTTLVNELRITGGSSVEVPNGETSPAVNNGTDYGAFALVTDPAVTHTFTLTAGTGNLNSVLTAPAVSIAGNASFTITSQPVLTSGTGTLGVQYSPSVGTTNATLTINHVVDANHTMSFGVQAEGPASGNVPQMAITGANANATGSITSGETTPTYATWTDFGPTDGNGTVSITRTYTITNNGNATLDLTGGPPVSTVGANAADFVVSTQPNATVASGGGTTTFTITFTPHSATTETATVSIGNNTSGTPFTFKIQGEGETMTTSGDGLKMNVAGNATGTAVQSGELLAVSYTEYELDGTKFGSSNGFEFVLGDANVLAGLNEGFTGAKIGDQRTFIIPPALNSGTVPSAPAGQELIFVSTVSNIAKIQGGSPLTEILSGDTSPLATDGTDFGAFATVSSPAKTATFQLSVPSGSMSSLLAASNPISISGAAAFTVTQPQIVSASIETFTVKYTPSVGTTNATVTITNASGTSNEKFEVQAEGPASSNVAQMTVKGNNSSVSSPIATGETSPSQATWTDFGPTAADGSVPVTRSYTITNSGNGTLDLTGPITIQNDTTDFSVLTAPAATVAAGQSTTFTIQFKPTTSGTKTTDITIASNDPNGPFKFEVQGEALTMTTAANGLQTFASGGSGDASLNGELLVMNYTGYLTDGTKFDSSLNPGRTPFQFVLGQGNVIQGWDQGLLGIRPGESRTLIIPAALAYGATGSGSIPANATLIFTTTLVNAVGVAYGASAFIPNGQSVGSVANGTDFGTHALTDAPVTKTYTIWSETGSLSSVLTGTSVTIAGSPSFTVSPLTLNGTNGNGNSGTFSVTYTPSKGQTAATVTIHNVSASQPNLTFGVQATGPTGVNSGTGPKISVIGDNEFASIPIGNGSTATDAQQLWTNFGDNAIGGSTSVTRTYKITNTGTSNLTFLGGTPVTISGAGAADYTVTSQPTGPIAPNASADFTITFAPKTPGTRQGIVTITSNDSQNPYTFLITGNGLVVTTGADGLMSATTSPGTGGGAGNGEVMVMNYSGYLLDGTEFDSSLFPNRTPFQFVLGKGQVIKGWDEGLVGMKVGESRTLIIPASLAYGSSGAGSIPPNATLIFKTTLLSVISVAGQVGGQDVFIADGDNSPSTLDGTEFGFVAGGASDVTHTFVISAPQGDLTKLLAANPVSISGGGASAFTLSKPAINGGTATFTITYLAGSAGTNLATVSINNGTNGNPNLTFNVQGEGPLGSNGSVTTANTDQIVGFAYNPADFTDTVDVKFVWDSGLIQTVAANQNNTDVQNLTGQANHGFNYATPMMTVGAHTVSIYAVDQVTGTTTFLGTRTITSQNSLFDENYYLSQNPDVAAAVAAGKFATGYDQYIQFGQFEGRNPNPYWNEKYYLAMNPDVAAAVADGKISSGFMHYYLYGQYENRPGLVYLNTTYYLDNNPDVAEAINPNGPATSAFEQFCDFGQYEGRSPGLFFDQAIYEADNPDILPYVDGQPFGSAFEHYVLFGQYEGRTASNFFSGQTYLSDNADVKSAVTGGAFPDGLQHWLEYGQYEGRSPAGPDAANIATEFTLLGDGAANGLDYGNLPANVNNWIATHNT